jgi:hypothetical protein
VPPPKRDLPLLELELLELRLQRDLDRICQGTILRLPGRGADAVRRPHETTFTRSSEFAAQHAGKCGLTATERQGS